MNAHNRCGITFQNIEAAINVSIFGFRCDCDTSFSSKDNLPKTLLLHFNKKKCSILTSLPSDGHIPWAKLARKLEDSQNTYIASNANDILSQKKYKRNFCGNPNCKYSNFGFSSKRAADKHKNNSCEGFCHRKDAALVETYIVKGKKKIGRSLRFSYAEKLINDLLNKNKKSSIENNNKRHKHILSCPFTPTIDQLTKKMKNPPQEEWDLKKYITQDECESESVSDSLSLHLISFVAKENGIKQNQLDRILNDTFSEDDISGYFVSLNNAFPIFLNELRRKIVFVNPEMRGKILHTFHYHLINPFTLKHRNTLFQALFYKVETVL